MSEHPLYREVGTVLRETVGLYLSTASWERLTRLVVGIMKSESISPSKIAKGLDALGISQAQEESLARQIRRTQNDRQISAKVCVDPFVRSQLARAETACITLILDPTTQDERVVLLVAAVWYRGRALPLAWLSWPAQKPLRGASFWERVAHLLARVASLLPKGKQVVCVADRAFGTPAFTDLVSFYQWDFVVRVQHQTRCQLPSGQTLKIGDLVKWPGQRRKACAQVFKKRGWRQASLVVQWSPAQASPLCLVSSLPLSWDILAIYQRRYGIEPMFHDFKSAGWHVEACQVSDLDHFDRLLVGLVLAHWLVVLLGTQVATEFLQHPPSGRRRSRPPAAKLSLFSLGLQRLKRWLSGSCDRTLAWIARDWDAPAWYRQITNHHCRALLGWSLL